jgi:hypothetical protein
LGVYTELSQLFKNTVLRRIFQLRRQEVMGSWRNVHNEELHNLYASPGCRGGVCSMHGRDEKCIPKFWSEILTAFQGKAWKYNNLPRFKLFKSNCGTPFHDITSDACI